MRPTPSDILAPSRRSRRVGRAWRALAGLALLVGLVAVGQWKWYLVAGSPLFAIREIEVRGLSGVSRDDLCAWLGVEEGKSFLRLPQERRREVAARFPRIRSLSWRWVPWGRLRITIRERSPAILVVMPQGSAWEVAEDAVAWPARASLPDLPLHLVHDDGRVRLRRSERVASVSGLEEVLRWMGYLRDAYPRLWAEISQVQALGEDAWRLTLCSSRRVLIAPEGMDRSRWGTVQTILADLDHRGLRDAVLDLRFEGQVVVRKPKETGGGHG